MKLQRRRLCAVVGLSVLFAVAAAGQATPFAHSGSDRVVFVPWKVLNTAADAVSGDYIVYWVPASADDLRHSPLLRSRVLASYAGQCVGMQVVRPDDRTTIARLGSSKNPAVIVMDSAGAVLGSVDDARGEFNATTAEQMVRDSLIARQVQLDRQLDEARTRSAAGDRAGAIELYRRIAAQKCFAPRNAREAARNLKKLEQ